jgi:PPOX class probable F420-dependent enzyme
MPFPQKFADLFQPETKAFLFLATIMPDGSPQVTPVWFDTEGEYIRINTNEGRTKDRNMRARPKVALVIQDLRDPYRYLQIRGEVIERTYEGADDHIDMLSRRYDDKPWVYREGQKRVIYKIKPVHFDQH